MLTLTPTIAGDYSVICNEFCGIGHHTMTGKIYVDERKAAAAAPRLAQEGIRGEIKP